MNGNPLLPDDEFEAESPQPPPLSEEVQRELCRAAADVREAAPWKRLANMELLGIENPETGELGLVSILGMGGEMQAFHWHHGEGSRRVWHGLITGKESPDVETMFRQIEMVGCEFVGASQAEPEDRELWRTFGQAGRKRKAVPMFRSYRPGFYPWFLEEAEARDFVRIMDLFLQFLPQVAGWWDREEDESRSARSPFLPVLRRMAKGTDGWILDAGRLPEPGPLPVPEEPAEDGFTFRLAGYPVGDELWEVGSMWLPQPAADGARPYYPKVALCLSLETGEVSEPVIYGGDKATGDQQALRTVFERLAKMRGCLPETLRVGSDIAEMAFRSLAGASRMKISRDSLELFPGLAQALAELEEGSAG